MVQLRDETQLNTCRWRRRAAVAKVTTAAEFLRGLKQPGFLPVGSAAFRSVIPAFHVETSISLSGKGCKFFFRGTRDPSTLGTKLQRRASLVDAHHVHDAPVVSNDTALRQLRRQQPRSTAEPGDSRTKKSAAAAIASFQERSATD